MNPADFSHSQAELTLSPLKLLVRYALPMMGSMLLMQGYYIVDTIFIARAVGPEGLAALNIVLPIMFIGGALGTMIAVGASAMVNTALGASRIMRARRIFTAGAVIVAALSLAITAAGLIFLTPLLRFAGAVGEVIAPARSYLTVVLPAVILYLLGFHIEVMVRAEGRPGTATAWTAVGAAINVVLDALFLFVFRWGMAGAALATVIGQVVMVVGMGRVFFLSTSRLRPAKPIFTPPLFRRVFANGASEFLAASAGGITLLAYNRVLSRLAGVEGVAAFAVVSTITGLVIIVVVALAQSLQPVWGQNHGAGLYTRARTLRRVAVAATFVVGVASYLAMYGVTPLLTRLMVGDHPSLVALTTSATRIMGLGFLVSGVSMVTSSYLTALERAGASLLVSSLRSLVLILVGLHVLPPIFGLTGVWLVSPFTEVTGAVLSVPFILWIDRAVEGIVGARKSAA